MKITKVEIEGPNGRATLTRPKNRANQDVEISGRRTVSTVETSDHRKVGVNRAFALVAVVRPDGLDVWHAAVEFHMAIEGFRGTNSDVQEYVDLIRSLAD